jgi:MHS family proline/betaine transporter-like MFS transporter
VIYLTEQAAPGKRALTAVWTVWGASAGILLGSGAGAVITGLLDPEQISSWGWRIPFLLGGLGAVTGVLLRRSMHVDNVADGSARPVRDTFGIHRGSIARIALLNIGYGVAYYTAFVYSVTYIKQVDDLPAKVAFDLNTTVMLLMLILMPLAARLSDRIGRRPLLITGFGLLTFGTWPLFWLIHHSDPALIMLGEAGLALSISLVIGGLTAASVELIPQPTRCTGLAFAYNASIGYFGGTTPMIAAWLVATTGVATSPAWWVIATGAISLVTAIFFIPETREYALSGQPEPNAAVPAAATA